MTTTAEEAGPLIGAVESLRAQVAAARLPLDLVVTAGARSNRGALLHQLDDYVLPRLRSLDAPLLAVIGGSTGAGKSTLVNSIVGNEVSRSGVLRPTTTSPVLVHHPDDEAWFSDRRILPGLSRVTGAPGKHPEPGTVRLVASSALPAGMALLDAPDIDSVVHANRAIAEQLLMAADLWLFVTTAARYADAVPWDLLRDASARGTAVAIVLDRVEPDVVDEVRPHLVEMLRDQGLGTSPVFTVPESSLTPEGLLPESATSRLRAWLEALAGDARARSIVVAQTLRGAMASLDGRVDELVDATRVQAAAADALRDAVETAYASALAAVEEGVSDGTLLRGEVLARWQELVGTGEFFKQVETTVSRVRDRMTAAVTGRPRPEEGLDEALHTGVAALVRAHGESASSTVARAWRRLPGGAQLLDDRPELASPDDPLGDRADRLVRDWQGQLLQLIRSESGSRRTNARVAAYGVNGVGLFLMLVTFAHTGGLTGAEVGIAGGTSVLAQRVLEAIFGDQAVRSMAAKARRLLVEDVTALYAAERGRFEAALEDVGVADGQAEGLARAMGAVREANP
ncbi:putative ABC transporter [Nostocoides japonicum T1-X7]|uniref:Putative ABC transporter n=1 Tax=Nostocoides japonicum T1-X7 TaxID=1194083 RepID=A0A077LZX8_9MICO|nr:putative ABC transporter [Tetrasphaera japonica T1-X7]